MFHLGKERQIRSHSGFSKFFWASGLITLSAIIGTIGYMVVEDYTVIEALYMAILVISTVGFHEVHPLSDSGRVFTSIYIIFNFATLAYAISVITIYVFEGEFRKIFKHYLINKKVKKLKDHVIVCGYGRNGAIACEELAKGKQKFVVIENKPEILKHIPDNPNFDVITGEPWEEEILELAGIRNAKALIISLQHDADNIVIALTAKGLNPNVQIVSKASSDGTVKKLMNAGAHSVVKPYSLGGIHLANLITRPYVIEFLELITGISDHHLKLEEFQFQELKEEYKNRSIKELDIRKNTGATVIGFKVPDEGFVFNPSADTIITEDAVLIVLGTDESIASFKMYCV